MALFNRKKEIEEKNPSQTAQNAPQDTISPEEQLMRRQSAPRPTAESEAQRLHQMQMQRMMQGQGLNDMGAMNGFKALAQVIGKEQVQKANSTLQRYKEGKANLVIAVGCTGGHHRSVAVAHALAEWIGQQNYRVVESHRDISRG